jgi:hypothetical protein
VTPDDDTAVLPPVRPDDTVRDGAGDDLAAEIARAAPQRWWNRGTVGLGVAVLMLAAFLGGLQAQKHWGTDANAATDPFGGPQGGGRAPGGDGNVGPFGGTQGPGGGAVPPTAPAAGPTTGKVKLVDGTTIYVETAGGTTVVVRTNGSTAVRTTTAGELRDVKPGDTVSVQGATGADGTVNATTVTEQR